MKQAVQQGAQTEETGSGRSDLAMSPEAMLDLARKAAALAVSRIKNLAGENAWDGEFKEGLERLLLEEPPEAGRPADEVMQRAAKDILPLTTRPATPHSRPCT